MSIGSALGAATAGYVTARILNNERKRYNKSRKRKKKRSRKK